eukprot:TRINITY_DN1272_c0_g1_i1.p1 TRINITY_DN1272_c0_g1~~TRINITY_DN1272_c0_g1_i1.p1  ORF type:complete len:576 (-),score=124.16 TRINITY_DN1272_c0_g1_i1:29-1756(-)
MQAAPLVECVPNFSEGNDAGVIKQITDAIVTVEGVKLLDVDPGKATNRTVVTFVGHPEDVIEAAFRAYVVATKVIDMSKHKGEHPRFGAVDVCPLVPLSNITMEETAQYAHRLGERVGQELGIPIYFYESAAKKPERKNLATCRAGEYEALEKKLADSNWAPDCGSATFNEIVKRSGASAVGARNFLVAYNVNLNTTSVRRANAIAFDIRETGRIAREGNPVTGKIINDEHGEPVRVPGSLKCVKAIGWYIEEYGIAQISINLTDVNVTSMHVAFNEVCIKAQERGLRVTGSELVGLVPKSAMLDAGKYFLRKQQRSLGISEDEIIKIAIKSLGLNDVSSFDPKKKIIEYILEEDKKEKHLVDLSLKGFANELASESVAPGGGSAAAYVGALGVSLSTMVANVSSHKAGWDDRWEEFSSLAEQGQALKAALIKAVDEDTAAFNAIMDAVRLPKANDKEIALRNKAMDAATQYATQVPLTVMKLACQSMDLAKTAAETGLASSVSDAGVAALCGRTAVMGAYLNVKANTVDMKDKDFADSVLKEGAEIAERANALEAQILAIVSDKQRPTTPAKKN